MAAWLLVALFALLLPAPALAVQLFVDSSADAVDAAPGDGACATNTGECTLRAALQEANALAGADVVRLPPGRFSLSLAGRDEDAGATGDLDVSDAVTLVGAGRRRTVVDAGGLDRVLDAGPLATLAPAAKAALDVLVDAANADEDIAERLVASGRVPPAARAMLAAARGGRSSPALLLASVGLGAAGPSSIVVSGLTLTGGAAEGEGGGVRAVRAPLVLEDVDVRGNSATTGGGGVSVLGADATLRRVKVRDNVTAGVGGGVNGVAFASLTFDGSVVSGNVAESAGGIQINLANALVLERTVVADNAALTTGGIEIDETAGAILRSTIRDNRAGAGPGGLFLFGTAEIAESTISGNRTGASGGGIGGSNLGSLRLTNSTVSGNVSGARGGGIYFPTAIANDLVVVASTITGNAALEGGGIFVEPTFGSPLLRVRASILADNAAATGPDCFVTGTRHAIQSGGWNVVGNATGCAFAAAAGDLVGAAGAVIDPRLHRLGRRGGPTRTHEPRKTSPAIDLVPASACLLDDGDPATFDPPLTIDQRGAPRPRGAACDAGAVER